MDPRRFGIYFGCGEAFEEFSDFLQTAADVYATGDVTARSFLPAALKIFNPETEAEYDPAAPAAHLAGLLGAQGPNANCITACASATQAIGQAWQIIRRGQADVMLTGGAHSMVHPFGLTGFYPLSTLSIRNEPAQSPRPFDRDRDGFVIGEGGAAVVLEELQHARRRGAEIWAELSGYASAHDAYRVTDVHPEGRGCVQAITRALKHAGINPTDLDYVNAHGTGTLLNDRIETLALKRALGPHAYRVSISSTKSMLGHATTASGAIELLACVLAIRHGVVPPTINYHTPDPECDLDYVPNVARELECRSVLNNSIGFGGQNSALIVSRFEEASRSAVSVRQAA
jgi:3-oxoacyl-[acyl-carrier-protein] synthase II